MNDNLKTKDQLIRELIALRRRVSELEAFEEEQKPMKVENAPLETQEVDPEIKLSPLSGGAFATSVDSTERAHAGQALRKSQKRVWMLAHALESCSHPFAMTHFDGRIMTYNAAFCKMTGYNKEELSQVKRFMELVPLKRREEMENAAEEIRRTKQPKVFETELIRKDGSLLSAEASQHPAHDSKGNLRHCFFFFADISNHRHLNQALAECEARFRAIIENNPVQTIVVDAEGRVTFSNLLKTKPEKSLLKAGDEMFKDFADEGEIHMRRELMTCLATGLSKDFPEQKYDDGLYHLRISPFKGGALITLEDVTTVKSMITALKESEERFHVVSDFAPHWESWIGENGRHVYVSPACEQITGYGPEEFQKDTELLKAITHPDDRSLLEAHYGVDFRKTKPANFSFRILKRDGEARWICHDCRPVHGPDGRFMGRRASNRDCTDRKEMESDLRVQASQIDDVKKELSQYYSLLSGDLRAPLRAIRNYADFLRHESGEKAGNDHEECLEGLRQAVKEAEDLLEDLFEFSQIDSGNGIIERVHMGDFLRQLITNFFVSAEAKFLMEDEWPTLEIQKNFLQKIFENLIDNALKFNNASRKIVEIAWRSAENQSYEFCVRDNGIGIQPRYFDQVFGIFQRLHTLEEYEGNGIGLAIVKKLVNKLGGSVRLISKPGEGSTFFVTLPQTQRKDFPQQTARCSAALNSGLHR